MNNYNPDFHLTLQEWAALFARRSILEFQEFIREYRLNAPQISVLFKLYSIGPTTILQIRNDLMVSRSATSQMIDDLVQQGWVERAESPYDRRMKVVSLTNDGYRLVDRSIQTRHKWLDQLAEAISPEQCAALAPLLRTLVETAASIEVPTIEKPHLRSRA